jgi:glutamate synthase (NADPH/NADH) small chain
MTPLSGVFAAGDIVRGASLVVWGIRDGRDAAQSMQQFLSVQHPQTSSSCGLTAGSMMHP